MRLCTEQDNQGRRRRLAPLGAAGRGTASLMDITVSLSADALFLSDGLSDYLHMLYHLWGVRQFAPTPLFRRILAKPCIA